jgi:hypothetical protein
VFLVLWTICFCFFLFSFEGIISEDGVLTGTIGAQFMPKQSAAYLTRSDLHLESRESNIYDATNSCRGNVDVKWRELDFSHLLSSALKCAELGTSATNSGNSPFAA